ncbi:hypothetical protein [Aquipluma nitroreducens]|uniref:hypothetical protein n=1 Tax=Aquipluma nitroreducens TaxID=2010828 RepID=UPI00296F3F39|nr:hypothetical protein [Aquipluma nitroreducens]
MKSNSFKKVIGSRIKEEYEIKYNAQPDIPSIGHILRATGISIRRTNPGQLRYFTPKITIQSRTVPHSTAGTDIILVYFSIEINTLSCLM